MRSAQYCSLPLRLVHGGVRCGQAEGTGWGVQVQKLVRAMARWLGYMQQLGCCISSKSCNLEPTCLEIHCRWCIQYERTVPAEQPVLPSRKMSTTGEKNQLLQLYGRTRESSLLELYCRTKQTRQEGMQIDSQSFESRGVRHACFCMLTLLVLTYFLLCVSSLLWCVLSFPSFIFALSLGCCSA